MSLTTEQFDVLVEKLEDLARQHPDRYRRRVGFLAVLGYLYMLAVVLALLSGVGVLIWFVVALGRVNSLMVKLGFLLLIPVFIILRSLFVSFPPPEGVALSRQQAPTLFQMVDQLTQKLQAPQFHHILLTDEFNAAVVQIPRLGMLGWQQNYLLVGLPLMQALSIEQFRAVLAHELGHLSGNHSRFHGWIYRQRKTWSQIYERLNRSDHHNAAALFDRFLNWYSPFFNAYSFVLGRMNEYEADRCAAELTTPQNAAETLIAVSVRAKFFQESYWNSLYKQADREVTPPNSAFTDLPMAFQKASAEGDQQTWLDQALRQQTSNDDTHPCLRDRLAALGFSDPKRLAIPQMVKQSAAEQLFDRQLEQFTSQFDRNWQTQVETPWRQRYAYVQEKRQQLQALTDKAKTTPLTEEEAWHQAYWTLECDGETFALPLFQQILATQPDHVGANFNVGQILLSKDDEAGIDYLERAMRQRATVTGSACELIYYFLKRQGRLKAAQQYLDRFERHAVDMAHAQAERSTVNVNDQYRSHDLPAAVVESLLQQLQQVPALKEVYLVQKVVTYFPEEPFYVLGVVPKGHKGAGEKADLMQSLINTVHVGDRALYIVFASGHLYSALSKVAHARIYPR